MLASPGSGRLEKLLEAAQSGADCAPVDLRYIKRPRSHTSGEQEVRSSVVSYLNQVYESTAETLPDLRDTTFKDADPNSLGISVVDMPLDSYSAELNRESDEKMRFAHLLSRKNVAVKKPRKKRRSVVMNAARLQGEDAKEVRWLPPGSMKEIWDQYRVVCEGERLASFPTFWRVI